MLSPLRKSLTLLTLVAALSAGAFNLCPPVEAKPKAVKMDTKLRRELNTFFSNFSEAYVDSFKRKQLSDEQMIEFAFHHEWVNKSYPDNYKISVARVNALANWYFGVTVKRHALPADYKRNGSFRNGIYTHGMGDGDPLQFSQVATLTDLGNGEFSATTNDFETHDQVDFHGYHRPVKKTDCSVWEEACFTGKHQALIKRVGEGKRRRFILLEYLKLGK